jgi:hypothetical protein
MTVPPMSIAGAVFIASYGGGHAAALAPVVDALIRAGVHPAVMAFTTARDYFARRGITTFGYDDVLDTVPGYDLARPIGRALALGETRHALISAEETEAYLGAGYVALERFLGADEASVRYARLGRQSFCPVDFFEQLFTLHRPAVVVATNSPRSERAALEAARNLQIPSLCLVDLYALHEIEWCGSPNYCEVLCVLNDAVKRHFVQYGVPAERVVITGNPAFDRIGAVDVEAERTRYRGDLGLEAADKLLVWISQPEPLLHPFSGAIGDPTLPARIERGLAEMFAGPDGSTRLVLRLHPSEHRPPAVAGPLIRYSNVAEPLDPLLCAADCVVTCSSTVGLEAAMLGIPVVQLMNSVFSPDLPLGKMGLALEVPNQYEAGPVIAGCLRHEGRSVSRAAQVRFDATERVAAEILRLLELKTCVAL